MYDGEIFTALSNWIQFHIKKAPESVQIWTKEVALAEPKQRLSFFYVANDVLQNSKKKSTKFVEAFSKVLPETIKTVLQFVRTKNFQKKKNQFFTLVHNPPFS